MSIVAASFFVWGFLAHRHKVFPHSLLKFAATEVGILEPDKPIHTYPSTAPLAVLKTLPYITASFDPENELRGVVEFDRNRAQSGLNFYNVDGQTSAHLIDMDGDVIHGWSYDYPSGDGWHTAELLSDGSLIVVIQDHVVLKIDKCSELVWSYETRAHHDVWVDDEGNIYVVTLVAVQAPDIHGTNKSRDDRIMVLTADGIKQTEVSVLGLLRNSRYEYLLPSVTTSEFTDRQELDPIHTNHVEVFDGSLAELSPLFERGNVLISMRSLNAIAILDSRMKEIIWLWGPNNIALQHHPRLLPNGHLLVFDNGTERSRVVELDPAGREVVWTYANGKEFWSSWGGSAQRLPNGNTLITETSTGYVREVTPEGQVVWKFANPEVDSEGRRSNIWRMTRFLLSDLNFLDAGDCNPS